LFAGTLRQHRKGALLESVPLGITASIFPVLAPAGTAVVIRYLDSTLNVAAVPLKLTLVAPVTSLPRILTPVRTSPEVVCVSTNGPQTYRQAEYRAIASSAFGTGPASLRYKERVLSLSNSEPAVKPARGRDQTFCPGDNGN
jgi:hypothetical protein